MINFNCDISALLVGILSILVNISIAIFTWCTSRKVVDAEKTACRMKLVRLFVLYFGPAYKVLSSLQSECKEFSVNRPDLEGRIAGKIACSFTNAAGETVGFDVGDYVLYFNKITADKILCLKCLYEEISSMGSGRNIVVQDLSSKMKKAVLLWQEIVEQFSQYMKIPATDLGDLMWNWVVM